MLRDSSNPMELSDYDFGKHFRVNKEIFLKILDAITPHLPERKRTFILPMTKLAVFLNFLGTGSFQNGAGSSWSCKVSQPLVSRIISEHLNVFEDHLCSEYITLNDSLDEDMTKRQYFYRKYKIPGVVGCLGGTHIKINTPSSLIKQDYLNRKGYYSLNVMIICDHNLKIDYIDARYPGSTNDSVIWIDSEARKYFNEQYSAGKRNTWLLGDTNYPLEIFLMTPYQNHVKPHEIKFNECHSKAYNTIRRCIGVLKSRFKSISSEKLYYIPQKATQIINACSVLHNICIKYKDNVALDKVFITEQCVQDSSDILPDIDSPTSVAAQEMRNEIANSLLDM